MAGVASGIELESDKEIRRCVTCNATLTGRYCAQCGESVLATETPTVWHFVSHNLLHELTHLDGKVFLTLRYLFFHPGLLSREYFAGRRQPYINPIRLLLTAIIAFAFLAPSNSSVSMSIGKVRLSMLPPGPPGGDSIEETASKLDLFGLLTRQVERIRRTKNLDSPAVIDGFHHELKTYSTALSFSNVLLLACLLFLFFHRLRPYFVQHFVFSLHLASFVLLFSIFPLRLFDFIKVFVHAPESQMLRVSIVVVFILTLFCQLLYLQKGLLVFYYPDVPRRKWWSRAQTRIAGAVFALFLSNSLFLTVVYAVGAAIALARL